MSETEVFTISIPTDEDGQVLLKCPVCNDLFKVGETVFGDDSVFEIHCPSCGIVSDNYVTDDVLELGMQMVENYANDLIEKEFKKFAKSTKNSLCKFSYRSNYKKHSEQPIKLTIENMTLVEYPCCKRSFKIKPLLRLCGSYCPYCGEKYYGIE